MTIVDSAGTDVGGLGAPALVSGRLLRSFSGWLAEDGDASLAASFALPMQSCRLVFAGISNVDQARLLAYNAAGTLVGSSTATAAGQQVLMVAAPGIRRLAILPGSFNDWVGVDNLFCAFDTETIFVNGFDS